jgi:rare lipoprotein A
MPFSKAEDALSRAGRRVLAALAIAAPLLTFTAPPSEAKAPGMSHCHNGICHRVLTLGQTRAQTGKVHRIAASHYDDCRRDRFNPCGLTSSGEAFRADEANNTASSIHPDGTILVIRNPSNQRAAVVRVNNFGPFKGNRKLDVSRATAERLGFARQGVAALDVMVVHTPTEAETRYRRNRRYEPVAGYIGRMASIDHAVVAWSEMGRRQRFERLASAACRLAKRSRVPRLALVHALPRAVRPHA